GYMYVDPFIGTAKSDVVTKWGDEGGTYPGAVAPSGFIQLSPETHVSAAKGYNYYDSSIYFFSCLHHASGFPEGSSGRLYVMPVTCEPGDFKLGKYSRPFSHKKEKAEPGYYKVAFSDDGTLLEATVAQRSGMFRFTFPENVIPEIFIGDAGKIEAVSKNKLHLSAHHAVINFDKNFSERKDVDGGSIFVFKKSACPQSIIFKISASTIDEQSAQKNIDKELGGLSFDALYKKTKQQWSEELSVAEVEDANEKNKTIFYTALYHSLLIPWIISDADGNYRGHDGLIHKATGKNEYGQFSPWDTFRSLHPLLCLLYPDKQKDMVLSMLDIFKQTHRLPTESMTGNHSVPIIVDSYLKGIEGIDSNLAYDAMKKSIMVPPFKQDDLSVYHEKGYVPFLYPESVTRTVEYAYDDWALSQFAKKVMHDNETYSMEQQRGLDYKNLFNASELFLLPRNNNEFKLQPGNSGYKEGDQWVYSFFVPQNANDLINLMGGDSAFSNRLDTALTEQKIIFDNETVFHLPYLFNEMNRTDLTQKWIRKIMRDRFNATPGGLPGNDDLGAVSSWYVFSAFGFYPFCPGNPYYTIGSPIFKSVTLHLVHQKKIIIKSTGNSEKNIYVRSVSINNKQYKQSSIAHSLIKSVG
ncbi:MAG: GH92 family glycosyl hydrolase, partial [Bacteroidetes bacterium]|nr:GH92 family glycosyl hydrolase [Bacteroidota bacterium]